MIWLVERGKNNHAARAARLFSQTATWKFRIWGSDDKASSQKQIFHSLPLQNNHPYQVTESARSTYMTNTEQSQNTFNLKQSSVTVTFSLQQLS